MESRFHRISSEVWDVSDPVLDPVLGPVEDKSQGSLTGVDSSSHS